MMRKFLSLTFFIGIVSAISAQSLLWKVTGKDIASPSYLYGTFHIQDDRVFSFDSTVWKAYNSCEAFAGELLFDDIDMKAVRQSMMLPKGQTISDMLSKEDFAILDSICKAKLGASAIFLNTMKPFFLITSIQQMDFNHDQEEALDIFFQKQAQQQGKSCYGLEKYIDQINALDAIPLKEQVTMMVQFLHDTSEVAADENDKLIQTYLAFELDSLVEMTQDTSLPPQFGKILVDKRNVTMAKGFQKIAKKERLFCAVGAAHLGGKKGIIALLRKKGYTVEPVLFQWTK